MRRVFHRPYLFWTITIFFLYLLLATLISGFYDTIRLIAIYASTINWFKLSVSLVLSVITGALVAINAVYLYILHKSRQQCHSAKTLTGVGTATGLLAGVCPLCVTGLIPLLLGWFGVSFTLGSLPFQGVEVQITTVVLLSLSLYFARKKQKSS